MRIELAPSHIKAEAERRILARYPIWKQLNLTRDGGEALQDMTRFIDGIRARSNRLETLPSIPLDYTHDKHWTLKHG